MQCLPDTSNPPKAGKPPSGKYLLGEGGLPASGAVSRPPSHHQVWIVMTGEEREDGESATRRADRPAKRPAGKPAGAYFARLRLGALLLDPRRLVLS